MAASANLRLRRTEAQRHALAGVEREIRANDQNGQRKYLRDFSQAFRSYESVLNKEQLDAQVRDADLLLVGDYHALPAAQKFAARLLEERAHPGDRPVVLGLETIFSRDQHILDEWWRREIDPAELRERIRFDLDWGYDWAPFYELLLTAREHAHGVYGLDCMPREDLRKIGARDRHAAHKVAEIRSKHPNAVILVVFGESHLAPGHLPQALREQLPQERVLTVLQNVDSLYWQAAGEKGERVEAAQVSDDVVCVFNSTPLEKYENYRLHLSRWGCEAGEGPDPGPTIYNLIDTLLRFLDINRYSSHNGTQPRFLVDLMPEVYGRAAEGRLARMLLRHGVTQEQLTAVLETVDERGSAYLPAVNAFYLREFQMRFAAEEAARFLHHACRGLPERNGVKIERTDLFYTRVVENALAYFGSRVLDPSREPVGDARRHVGQEYLEAGAQLTGYMLGSRLYDDYIAGRASRSTLRQLFLAKTDAPGEARKLYQELAARAQPVRARARAAGAGR